MLNYPGVCKDNLFIAVYWSKWNQWTLLSLVDFKKISDYSIDLCNALKVNKFDLLGERIFIGVPPIKLELVMDLEEQTIREIKCYTGKGLVSSEEERRLLFDLICYGLSEPWTEENYAETIDRKLSKIVFEYHPPKTDSPLAVTGWMSRIIAKKYDLMTAEKGKIKNLIPEYREDLFNFYNNTNKHIFDHIKICYLKNQ